MSLDSKVTQVRQKHTQTKSADYRIPGEKTIRPSFVKRQLQATTARPNQPQLHTGPKQAKVNWPKPTYPHTGIFNIQSKPGETESALDRIPGEKPSGLQL
ncbi:hypothetical protein Nepgr_021639 [Nepenthes gracilis]|uniref:Uncharacterized protein n=1 Tax=Nepenthes gracilis TaxID=150966 RepID=A0AAD3XW86_NEPGR|nr:hypothetical protein Nepgr_021639 [Nepenthes gracilis]